GSIGSVNTARLSRPSAAGSCEAPKLTGLRQLHPLIRWRARTSRRFRFTLLNRSVMPFKSQAQRRKFAELLVQGKISATTFEEWNRETGAKKLPERAKPKAKTTRKRNRR